MTLVFTFLHSVLREQHYVCATFAMHMYKTFCGCSIEVNNWCVRWKI